MIDLNKLSVHIISPLNMCVRSKMRKIGNKSCNTKTLIQEDFYLTNIYNGKIVINITNLKMFMWLTRYPGWENHIVI